MSVRVEVYFVSHRFRFAYLPALELAVPLVERVVVRDILFPVYVNFALSRYYFCRFPDA